MIAETISASHDRYLLAGAIVAMLGSVVVAWISNRRTRLENTDQHAAGQRAAEARHEQMLAALTRQDEVRGDQVDGLHTAIGKVDGKLDAHINDVRAHGKQEA